MTPFLDVTGFVSSLSWALFVIPAVLGLLVLRAVLIWRADRREEQFAERCRSIDVDKWRPRKAA